MYKLAFAAISLFFLTSGSATAAGSQQDKWVVTQLSGDARVVHPGAQPASLKVNNLLAPGDMLLTGPSGRATLVHGADYIVVAPRSELRLPTTPEPSGFTRVVQNLGTLLFKVKHTGIPHFTVDTPMLAAVVKGTTFTVVVGPDRSAVQVIDGKVDVSALEGGMSRLVEGGRTVFVNRSNPRLLLDADKPVPASGSPSSTSVSVSAAGSSPLDAISQLTGGLVRAETGLPPAPAALPIVQSAQVVQAVAPASDSPAQTPVVVADATVTTPGVTVPPTTTPAVTVPSVTSPSVTVPPVTVALVTTPAVTVPSVTTPAVTVPSLTVPAVTLPAITTPVVTVPSITTPAVTLPAVTVPAVTVPAVTVPAVTLPSVTLPPVTTPVVTLPPVTLPPVTTPPVTLPPVTTPVVSLPPVTVPAITVPVITVPVLKLKL
jgi:hypothetical protein